MIGHDRALGDEPDDPDDPDQRDTNGLTIRCGEEQLWNAVLVNGGDEEVLFSIQLGPTGPTAVPMEAANM